MQGILGRIPPQVSPQVQRRLEQVAVVVLVVLLAHGLARLTWTLWPTRTRMPPAPTVDGADGGGNAQANDWSRVAGLHLFGQADRNTTTERTAPVDAPETQLNLTLNGILYNEDQDKARAIIAGASGPQKFYRTGDQLPGGATLDAIYKDRVMLLRNGRHETLRLPEEREGTAMESYDAGRSADQQPRVGAGRGGEDSLSDFRQRLLEDPAQIQQYLQGRPEMRDGEMVGFRVQPGADPSLFRMTGLKAGDIITAVGDVQIDSPDKGFQVFDELSRADSVTLTVIRDGSQTQIPINFQN